MKVQRLIDTGAISGPYRKTRPMTRWTVIRLRVVRLLRAIFH